jgi:hypothetical protein
MRKESCVAPTVLVPFWADDCAYCGFYSATWFEGRNWR